MPDPPRRLLCARHPHLGLVAALRRHPELRGEAVIIGGAPELRLPVLAASAAAVAAGVCPGQPLRRAQQLCPQAVFIGVDGGDVERVRADVITALGQLSHLGPRPRVMLVRNGRERRNGGLVTARLLSSLGKMAVDASQRPPGRIVQSSVALSGA